MTLSFNQSFAAGLVIGSATLFSLSARAQPVISGISVSAGSIKTPHSAFDFQRYTQWAFFPKIEISSVFSRVENTKSFIGGSISVGGWNEGVQSLSRSHGALAYSYRSIVLGSRVIVGKDESLLPVSLWLGYSRRFIHGDHVQGTDLGDAPKTINDNHGTVEVGARISIPLYEQFLIGVEAERSFRSFEDRYDVPSYPRMMYAAVATYRFNS